MGDGAFQFLLSARNCRTPRPGSAAAGTEDSLERCSVDPRSAGGLADLDILLLFENVRAEQKLQAVLAELTRTLWDQGFRVSSAARTLEESKRVDRENAEFHLSMMDRRFLAGDQTVYQKL